MSDYKRLTKRHENGEHSFMYDYYDKTSPIKMLLDRLAELEDKIENGTLVEIPCKCGDNAVAIIDTFAYPNAILNVEIKGLAYIVEDENGDITFQHISRVFYTEAEAQNKLKELLK